MQKQPLLHHNPVYRGYFADPFVWRHQDAWYAIGTGEFEALGRIVGRVFPLLQSNDFLHWHFARSALMRPDPALGTHFWAPAVAFANNRFYLYYSVGFAHQNHRLRVASSLKPTGPYHDLGIDLVPPKECPFAIDPHPFQDHDGSWYLLFARDFLDHSPPFRPGTGLAISPLISMTQLHWPPTTLLRPHSDWHRFQADRPIYGQRYDWHTLEGPCLLKHDSLYYCFFSGGRWETDRYGVDYVTAPSPLGPWSSLGHPLAPRLLQSIPNRILGPGHNSIATGPDNLHYLIYHAWDPAKTARRMFINPLLWTPNGPRVTPTLGPQKIQPQPPST